MSAKRISNETLIVDDISDTGKTLKKLAKKNSITATLWVTPHTKYKPTYFTRVLKKNEWVVFPFETPKSSKYDLTIVVSKQKQEVMLEEKIKSPAAQKRDIKFNLSRPQNA